MGGPNCCENLLSSLPDCAVVPGVDEFGKKTMVLTFPTSQPRIGDYPPLWSMPLDEQIKDAMSAAPKPETSAWQCPGCGTYYAYWVSKCECQKRNSTGSASTTNFQGNK
jgi:hypothetical protein